MKTINYTNWFYKERITNNDDFYFNPIIKPDHSGLVFTPAWSCEHALHARDTSNNFKSHPVFVVIYSFQIK